MEPVDTLSEPADDASKPMPVATLVAPSTALATTTHAALGASKPADEDGLQFHEAFAVMSRERDTVAEDELAKLNVNVMDVGMRVIGTHDRLYRLVPAAKAVFIGFDAALFDELGVLARALIGAGNHYKAASKPDVDLRPLVDELRTTRELFVDDIVMLTKRNLLGKEVLAKLQRANGPKKLANDVLLLLDLYNLHWPAIASRTTVHEEERLRAERVANQLLLAVAKRDDSTKDLPEATKARAAAFTLFYRTYDMVRQVVTFLRWKEKDVEKFLPSLFPARRKKRKAKTAEATPGVDAVAEAAPVDAAANGATVAAPPPVATPARAKRRRAHRRLRRKR